MPDDWMGLRYKRLLQLQAMGVKGLIVIAQDEFMPTVIHQRADFSVSGHPTPDNVDQIHSGCLDQGGAFDVVDIINFCFIFHQHGNHLGLMGPNRGQQGGAAVVVNGIDIGSVFDQFARPVNIADKSGIHELVF